MNNTYFRLTIALMMAVALGACNNRSQTSSDKPADSTVAADVTSSPGSTSLPITGHLANLGLTPDTHWRGINLGDDFSEVKATEKGQPFEQDAKHIGYTVEFKNLESADMLYYQANQRVSAVEVDLFLNARQSVDAYQKELEAYFTSRYRSPKTGGGSTTWMGPSGEMIIMKDVSKGKDFGLKIKIGPANRATTASAK